MSESNLVVLPDMQAVENTEVEEVKVQEGVVSAASKKLDEEEKAFVGSGRAKMIFPHVVKTLRGFIEEDDRFADVFANTARTISECCAAVVDKSGDVMSDLEVYRKAVQFYFPNADVEFKMNVRITGAAPSEEEMKKPADIKAEPEKPKPATKPAAKPAPAKDAKPSDAAKETEAEEEKPKPKIPPRKKKAFEDDSMQLTLWG